MAKPVLNPDYYIRVTSREGTVDYVPVHNFERACTMAEYIMKAGVASEATVNHSFSRRVVYKAGVEEPANEPANDSWISLSRAARSLLARFRN